MIMPTCDECPFETTLRIAGEAIDQYGTQFHRDLPEEKGVSPARGWTTLLRGLLKKVMDEPALNCDGPNTNDEGHLVCPAEGMVRDAGDLLPGPRKDVQLLFDYTVFDETSKHSSDDDAPGLYL